MKKINYILIVISLFAVMFTGCSSCNHKSNIEKFGYDFEQCYQAANKYMVDNYGDSCFIFYEAQAIMSLPVNDSNFCDSSRVYEVQVVFQIVGDSTVIKITYPYGKYNSDSAYVNVLYGVWDEDLPLNVDDIPITLGTATTLYKALDINRPDGNVILMRRPDLSEFEKSVYFFFGCDSSFICIDTEGNLKEY